MKIAGVVLLILGVLALAYQGITYTSEEQVAKIGPLEATAEREKRVSVPPILGGALVLAGVVLLVVGTKRS